MTREEAHAWLRGERSMTNSIPQDPLETWEGRIAEADAAMTTQAYQIARAHKEGLLAAIEQTRDPVQESCTDPQDVTQEGE